MPTGRSDETVDTTPLLNNAFTGQIIRSHDFLRHTPSLRGAARFLRRAGSRRMMREPSIRVRESAAQQIEERQSDWAYSKPIVILDLVWNVAFVLVSIVVLFMSRNEIPDVPLRLWIVGYCFQCVLHMFCVCAEYKRRYNQQGVDESLEAAEGSGGGGWWSSRNSNSSLGSDGGDDGDYVSQRFQNEDENRYHLIIPHQVLKNY